MYLHCVFLERNGLLNVSEFESSTDEVSLIEHLCDKVCQWLAIGLWFSPGILVSSTNKTDRHDITEILLKVVLNIINQTNLNVSDNYIHVISSLQLKVEWIELNKTSRRCPRYLQTTQILVDHQKSKLAHIIHVFSLERSDMAFWRTDWHMLHSEAVKTWILFIILL